MVAATGFTVLSGSSEAARLQTVGTVDSTFRAAYDILVRPAGSRSALENEKGLVQSGFLTALRGGITEVAWRDIQAMSGIDVAAPIAMVGYVYPEVVLPVDVREVTGRQGDRVARVDVTWKGDNALTTVSATPDFAFVTDRPLRANEGAVLSAGDWLVRLAGNREKDICSQVGDGVTEKKLLEDVRPETRAPRLLCFSRTSGGASDAAIDFRQRGLTGVWVRFPQPYVVAAVDPVTENQLFGGSSQTRVW